MTYPANTSMKQPSVPALPQSQGRTHNLSEVTLDETNHVYSVGDRHPDSISKVLDSYFKPSDFYTEDGALKGTARHTWYHFLAQGKTPNNEPDPEIVAEIEGFKKFLSEVRPVYIFGERPLYDPVMDICGKPDLVCDIGGRPAVVDFKPKNNSKRYVAQIAGYACLLQANAVPVLDRYILRVLPGDYRIEQCKDREDLNRFRAMVAGFHAAKWYGGKSE